MRSDEVSQIDGETDVDFRATEDSLSGPFKIVFDDENPNPTKEEADIQEMHKVMEWISFKGDRRRERGAFLVTSDDREQMIGLIEASKRGVSVNGVVAHPFLDFDAYSSSYSLLVNELVKMASQSNKDIIFRFER